MKMTRAWQTSEMLSFGSVRRQQPGYTVKDFHWQLMKIVLFPGLLKHPCIPASMHLLH